MDYVRAFNPDADSSFIVHSMSNADARHRSVISKMLSQKIYVDKHGNLYHHRNRKFD